MGKLFKLLKWLVISLVLLVVVPALVVVATLVGLKIRNKLPWMYSYNDAFNKALYSSEGNSISSVKIFPEARNICLLRANYDVSDLVLENSLKEVLNAEISLDDAPRSFSLESTYLLINYVDGYSFIDLNEERFALDSYYFTPWCTNEIFLHKLNNKYAIEAENKSYLAVE